MNHCNPLTVTQDTMLASRAAGGRSVVVRTSVEIARSAEDVFAYLTDPEKLSTWQVAEEVAQLTPGPVDRGTRFREVHKTLGIRRVEITEVVVYEPGRRFDIRVLSGPPVERRWDFEPVGDGTRLTLTPTVRLPLPRALPSRSWSL